MSFAAVLLLALSVAFGETWALPSEPGSWLAFAYIATLGSVVLFALFVYTLERWTASAVAYNDLLIPLVTIAIATLLTGERLSPTFLVGGGVVLVGVFVGAFLTMPRRRAPSTTLPECIPVDPGRTAIT
jgi:drug/metabolite transporter (DMT)-like permease